MAAGCPGEHRPGPPVFPSTQHGWPPRQAARPPAQSPCLSPCPALICTAAVPHYKVSVPQRCCSRPVLCAHHSRGLVGAAQLACALPDSLEAPQVIKEGGMVQGRLGGGQAGALSSVATLSTPPGLVCRAAAAPNVLLKLGACGPSPQPCRRAPETLVRLAACRCLSLTGLHSSGCASS